MNDVSSQIVVLAALHGLLRQVRDLGLPLLAVGRVESVQTDTSGVTRQFNYIALKELQKGVNDG